MAHTVRFIHKGDAIDYTPAEAVSAGQVVASNDLLGVAKLDIAAGALGALAVTGVFDFPKASGSAIEFGESVYWDEAEEVAKLDDESGANPLIGQTVARAADDDETVRVRLSQGYVGNLNDDTEASESASASASASASDSASASGV